MQPRSIRVDDSSFTEDVHESMVAFTQFVGDEVPAMFQATPVNAVGSLLILKVLMILVASLSKEERGYLREVFSAPISDEEETRPRTFDAHFHWYRLCRKLPSSNGNWYSVAAGQSIDVVGCCTSFNVS